MSDYQDLLADLKTKRDELKLQMHLATREARDEFEKLEAQWEEFAAKAKLHEDLAEYLERIRPYGLAVKIPPSPQCDRLVGARLNDGTLLGLRE